MALLIVMTVSVQQVLPKFRKPNKADVSPGISVNQETFSSGSVRAAVQPVTSNEARPTTPWSSVAARVGAVRRNFIIFYPDSGSNIDSNVQLNSMADLASYLPRAAAIGFFAPFPNMWFGAGTQVGSTGRLLSGLESLIMYAVEGLAIFPLWQGRRRLSVWLLFLVAATGLIALGFVVVNVGALFRLRFAFLILIIILGAEGAARALGWFTKQPPEAKKVCSSD
jgi:hypothetical protein